MYINTRQCTSMYVNVRQCVLVAMPPKACSGRQKKRRAPDSSCPCGCRGVGLSQRTVYRHLAQRGMAVPNLESEMADDIVDGMDIRDEDDPADDALADASDDNGGAAQAQLGDGLFTRLRDLVGPLTVGAMLLLLLVVQVRLNLAAVGAQLVCEAMVCTSLAAVPLLALRHRFTKTVYPSEIRVQFCENECVGIIGNLGPNATCPKCTGPVTDGAGKAVHVILLARTFSIHERTITVMQAIVCQDCPLFSLEESLRLLFQRPGFASNLSYDNVPDSDDFNQVSKHACG